MLVYFSYSKTKPTKTCAEWRHGSAWAFTQFHGLVRVFGDHIKKAYVFIYPSSAKSRGVSPRNFTEFLRELSRSFAAKSRRENSRRKKGFLIFSAKKKNILGARGVPRRNAKKELVSWADLYVDMDVSVSDTVCRSVVIH